MVALVPAQISNLHPRPPAATLRRRSLPLLTTHYPLSTLFLSALCFHILTNCFSRNPFILITIRIAPGAGVQASNLSPNSVPPRRCLPRPCRGGKSIVFRHLLPLSRLFALLSALPPFVFNRLQPLSRKHRGWGTRLPASSLRPSETVARTHRGSMNPLLVPSYCASLNRFCIPSPIVPVPPPSYTPLRFRRLSFERVRTPHHTALSNAPSAYRPLDDWCRGWRNQHGIAGRQLSRGLLLPGQGCKGRLGGPNPPDPAASNHPCRTRPRSLPRTRSAHRLAQRRCHWRSGRDRALRIPARRRRQTIKISQVSCSLTAEAGRISRGSSAPQRRPRLFFFLDNKLHRIQPRTIFPTASPHSKTSAAP